jgi:hypothetical protein
VVSVPEIPSGEVEAERINEWPFQAEWPVVIAVVAAAVNAPKAITAAMKQATTRFVRITGS